MLHLVTTDNTRYLVQYWSDEDQAYITKHLFEDGTIEAAKTFTNLLMQQINSPDAVRIYDLQELKIVHLVSNTPF